MQTQKIFNKQTIYILGSFIAGFAVMTVELVSGRIVAPIIGSSVFTWTSVIGITLLGLAVGSFVGGKIADKNINESLPLSFLSSSILVFLIPILAQYTDTITNLSDSILQMNLYIALYLFLMPTFAIGLIQPLLLKRFAENFSKIGSQYGLLSFTWSAGGILGVFLTGFLFISYIGSRETLWLMSLFLFLAGGIFVLKNKKILSLFMVAFLIMLTVMYLWRNEIKERNVVFSKETNYYNAKIVDINSVSYGDSRILLLDFDFHSIQSEKPRHDYTEIYPVFADLKEDIKNILVIGAGAYTMPKYFKDHYRNSDVSVIEVDPELVNIANDFFDLKKYNINTIVGDAKIVAKKDTEKYDVIFGDAYNSFISVPWYLLTKEWNHEIKGKLNENGIYAINFIGSIAGEKSEFMKSVLNTFKISFPNFYIFAFGNEGGQTQNIVLVGINGDLPLTERDLYEKLLTYKDNFLANKLIKNTPLHNSEYVILTDNFSPVEKLMEPAVKDYFPGNLHNLKKVLNQASI